MKKYLIAVLTAVAFGASAQTPNVQIPYSHDFYQKFNKKVYNVNSRMHSSIRAYFVDDSLLRPTYDSLMRYGTDTLNRRSWVRRKLTEEHLVNAKGEDYTFFADFLPDFQIGYDLSQKSSTWLNTRGFQLGGTVGEKFSFYTSGFENQGRFANYYSRFVEENQVVPGQNGGSIGKLDGATKDWSYVSALVSYTPNKHLNLALGYDKNFIGDGYRSMLLSDVSSNYSFLRLRASLGNVQYQTIFAYMLDPMAPKLTEDRRLGDRAKWMAAHYVDWNATDRFSIGFFQAVTWADAEPEGKRGFDFNYVHPFIFLRPIESANRNSPDKMRIGFNAKYEILDKTTVYGQFMFDEFVVKELFAGNGFWANKFATQIGFRGSDLFKVQGLNYLAEFNTARPYTYAHFNRLSNYSNYNQPLAHPFGANFREILGILNYSYKRFDFSGHGMYARYGLDAEGTNFGKDIFKNYETRSVEYGSHIGQGLKTNLYYAQAKVAYLINPKYNLRFELSGIYRRESTDQIGTNNNMIITFGLRSTFRQLYSDF
ncbi:gliding motility protein RemB [Pedobacter sp. SYP-B3415]|uniref:gliding motility protein RemB n=1 Tax=Pedobacter sp. SYP-B3415 TaxID=2496641 RepID=UPI00101CE2B0|nr:gliding motility protein RemB [Pedobacter sp. SYP-B3415]